MNLRLLGISCAAALSFASMAVTAAPITKNYALSTDIGDVTFSLTAEPTTAALGFSNVSAFSLTASPLLKGLTTLQFGLDKLIGFQATSWSDGFALETLTLRVFGEFPTAPGGVMRSNRLVGFDASSDFFTISDSLVVGGLPIRAEDRGFTNRTTPFSLQPLPDTSVPEPTTLALLGIGLLGLARQAKRREA